MKRQLLVGLSLLIISVMFGTSIICLADGQPGGYYSTRDTAYAISVNTTYQDSFDDYYGEERWYRFVLSDDGYITLDFRHDYLDSILTFCDMYIYNSDRRDSHIFHWYTTGKDEYYRSGNIGLKAGTYYLKLKASSADRKNFYTTIYFQPAWNWEKELNDSPQKAELISYGGYRYGSIQAGPTEDWYMFNLDRTVGLNIGFEHEYIDSFLPYWSVKIYDSKMQKIKSYTISGQETDNVQKISLAQGFYYIEIDESQCWSDVDYKISLY